VSSEPPGGDAGEDSTSGGHSPHSDESSTGKVVAFPQSKTQPSSGDVVDEPDFIEANRSHAQAILRQARERQRGRHPFSRWMEQHFKEQLLPASERHSLGRSKAWRWRRVGLAGCMLVSLGAAGMAAWLDDATWTAIWLGYAMMYVIAIAWDPWKDSHR